MFRISSFPLSVLTVLLSFGAVSCSKFNPTVTGLNSRLTPGPGDGSNPEPSAPLSDKKIRTQFVPASTAGFQATAAGYQVNMAVVAHEPAPLQQSQTRSYRVRMGSPTFTWKNE